MNKDRAKQILSFLTCLLVIVAAAVHKDKRVLGVEISQKEKSEETTSAADTMRVLDDGTTVVYTASLAKDVRGYAGPVPLEIYIKEGKVQKVVALENSETPDFFEMAAELLTRWNGKTTQEAMQLKVDAVSGATFSSKAIITSVQRGLQYAQKNAQQPGVWEKLDLSLASLVALAVVLMGAVVPLFVKKNKQYRTLQLVLNVVVLGFWTGCFISYSLIVNYVANGANLWTSIVTIVMLVTAFVYPFFGKKNYYCTHICPCGSLQDLAGKANRRKWKMSKKTVKRLDQFRKLLWCVLMVLLISGIWASWMDYEIFIAFILKSASWVVLVLAAVFMILSIWVPRPYCRFVCPTGTLFKFAQNSK